MVAVTICNTLQFSRKSYRLSLFCQSADHTGLDAAAALQMREVIALINEQVGQFRSLSSKQDQAIIAATPAIQA